MRKFTYYKRHRMEVDLQRPPSALMDRGTERLPEAALPEGFRWVPWRDSLWLAHAEVKAASFQDETDSLIFPSLASVGGCRDLMQAIRDRPGFCPEATWLVESRELAEGTIAGLAGRCVATIQGVVDHLGHGGIQNVGVVPEFRGRGLGRALVLKALAGFRKFGVQRAYLEVTAGNLAAIRLYRDLGFRNTRTLYRAVPVAQLEPAAAAI